MKCANLKETVTVKALRWSTVTTDSESESDRLGLFHLDCKLEFVLSTE
jgi:hypothetical protein